MIDIRKLKELVRLMVENELSELDLEDQQETVKIRRGRDTQTVVNHQPVIYNGSDTPTAMPTAAPAAVAAAPAAATETPPASDDSGLIAIESPMVGTYYSAPNPDTDAYVTVGSQISDDTMVCLIEAMKVFNEIKAGVSGTIERILVKNGDSVEFGQKLFLVRPS
jgi:acetyl-CoA carboxylase biotin carboxyl carrier protein